MKVLRTDRLVLRPATAGDAEFLVVLMNDPSYLHFIGDRGVRTAGDARDYLASALVYRYEQGLGMRVVETREGGAPVGICWLVQRPDLSFADLGYALLPGQVGKGYALEAGRATLDYAFNDLEMPCVLAITRADNLRSRRVLETLGMEMDDRVMPGYEDRCVFRKTRSAGRE